VDMVATALPTAGTYYLKLQSSSETEEATAAWIRCGVIIRL
jgi:hypothetical protein